MRIEEKRFGKGGGGSTRIRCHLEQVGTSKVAPPGSRPSRKVNPRPGDCLCACYFVGLGKIQYVLEYGEGMIWGRFFS